jgi:flagellar biosynthesis protein FlhB
MAEHRAFPPSPRRRVLARQAGLSAASPFLVGAAAGAATLVALGATGRAIAHRLGAAIAAACSGRPALAPAALPEAVLAMALPIAGAAAIAATIAHLAQIRAAWLPRRRIPGAPALEAGALPRTRRAAGELAAATVIGGVAFAWLWQTAPHLAALVAIDPIAPRAVAQTSWPPRWPSSSPASSPAFASPLLASTAALLANLAVALVLAWIALGMLDALVRHAALARALAMTPAEKRQDDRLAGADPRWRARRAVLQRAPSASAAVAGASVVLVGDDAAVAIVWDPVRRPVPIRTATGRGPRASQLLGLARRYQIAIHRDPVLAAALVSGDGPVPEPHWPRLAEIVAAVRGRDRPA